MSNISRDKRYEKADLTDNETKTFLMKTFKCSRQAVWQALNLSVTVTRPAGSAPSP